MSNYPTNLTEKQWQVIKNIVDPQERNRKNPLREIVNGIFYVNKSGCQWRMLPSDFAGSVSFSVSRAVDFSL